MNTRRPFLRQARPRAGAAVATLVAVPLVVVLPVLGSSPARAADPGGTIVHLRDHNVWLVRPDGTGAHQVTKDGTYQTPYLSPSMSDAGIIAVGRGSEILRLAQNGQVLNRMDPPPLVNSAGQPTDGAVTGVAISPDGARIAWSVVTYSCPIGVSCMTRAVTGVTDASALTPNRIGANYYSHPSWVTNTRLMTHGGYGSHMMLQDLGGAPQHWFSDAEVQTDNTDLGDAEVSRDGTRLAAVRGYAESTHLVWGAVGGDPRSAAPASLPDPTYECFTNTDSGIHSPSWAPDNRTLVLADSDGLVVIAPGATCEAATIRSMVPGGSAPHWSPAALAPGAPPPGTGGTGTAALTLAARPRIRGKAVVGKRLRATAGRWSPSPATVTYRWMRNGKPIKGSARTHRVRKADRGKKLSVRVTVTRPGFHPASAVSKKVRVRR